MQTTGRAQIPGYNHIEAWNGLTGRQWAIAWFFITMQECCGPEPYRSYGCYPFGFRGPDPQNGNLMGIPWNAY
jgi:hypothetical protein